MALARFHKALHDEGLEELDRHFLGQTALIDLEFGTDDDDRTAGIVDALAEQVLAEPALLAAQQSGKGLELAVGRTGQWFPAPAVVDEGVHGFLQHALFVLDDHLGRAQLDHALQAVVAVDDAAVEIVQIGRSKSAAVELHHRAQIGRNDGKHGEDHPFGTIPALAERLDDLDALDRLDPLGAGGVALDDRLCLLALLVEVDRHQKLADRLRAHTNFQARNGGIVDIFLDVAHLSVVDDLFIGDALFDELGELLHRFGIGDRTAAQELCPAPDEHIRLALGNGAFLGRPELDHGAFVHLFEQRLHGVRRLDRRGRDVVDLVEVICRVDERVVRRKLAGDRLGKRRLELCSCIVAREYFDFLGLRKPDDRRMILAAQRVERAVMQQHGHLVEIARVQNGVCGKVDDLLERLGPHVQKKADLAGHAAEIPDMRDGRGKLDMPHAGTPHLRARNLHAALFADDALVTDTLILSAVAFPVLGGAEDLFAEQAVPFGLLRAVVDGLGLGDLAVRPFPDFFGRSNADLNGIEIV